MLRVEETIAEGTQELGYLSGVLRSDFYQQGRAAFEHTLASLYHPYLCAFYIDLDEVRTPFEVRQSIERHRRNNLPGPDPPPFGLTQTHPGSWSTGIAWR